VRILIVGGTRFVGRHIAQVALDAGHEVALLHRGRSGADLFPEATHLLADRNGDLGVLAGTRWDATVDVSAYRPGQVSALAAALAGNGGHYVYISSVSVYEAPATPGYAEDSPVRSLPPGHREAPIKVIDARDHAAFVLHGVSSRLSGSYHTVSPPMPFGALLTQVAAEVAPLGTRLIWVEPRFLLDRGETGETLPLWYAGDEGDAMVNTADPAAAVAAGLTMRPLRESIHDVRQGAPVTGFLSPARESELLAQWSTSGN
jgi:nucleoside-diphosphate-sugar epimerase